MDIPVERAGASLIDTTPDVVRVGQLVRLLRRHAWLIVGCAVVGAGAAYAYASSLPKSYMSSATLAVEGDHYAIPELQGALRADNAPDPMPWVRTEVQALTAPAIVRQVVTKLNLASDPEFNPALRPPSLLDRLKAAVRSLLPHRNAGAVTDPNEPVLNAASRALTVFQDNRSLVIDVAFTARDPALAARFVNTLIDDYIATRAARRGAANAGASTDMTQRIGQVRADLAAIEQKMRDLRSRSGVVGLRSGSVGQQQLEELATAADRATLERAQLEATFARANALAKQGNADALASVLGSDTISRLREQESEASRKAADLAAGHGANYPGVRNARSDLAAIRGQIAGETQRIVASLGAQLQVARAHEADVTRQLAEARDAAVKSQNTAAELGQLQADAASQRQVYQMLLERAQQAVVQTAGQAGAGMPDVRLLSKAYPSGFPSAPNMKMASGLGLIAGGILGCLIGFVRAERQDHFADAGELTEATGLPVAATLPRAGRGRRAPLLARIGAAPGGAEAEALRLLRARLRTMARANARSVVFTAADGAEPAAGVAAAFARVAAADGERVLLVEGDLRTPAIGKLIGLRGGGIEGVLRGQTDWRDALGADGDSPLDVLTADRAPTDASTLLDGVALQNLLMEARDDYSLVVLNAPDADGSAARMLAQRADMTVLVVDGRRARRMAVRAQAARLSGLTRHPIVTALIATA